MTNMIHKGKQSLRKALTTLLLLNLPLIFSLAGYLLPSLQGGVGGGSAGGGSALAQEVTVTVTPASQVLPPQAMLYLSDPGKYFNITLLNNTQTPQQVYLGIALEQVMPATGLSLSTPPRRQPQTPFTLSAGQARQLTMVEMKNLFNHIPKNEVRTSPGLFEDYERGAFGLLPEGQYEGQVIAYKWDLALARPVALSSPTGGKCRFTICYKAQAPEFLTPAMQNGGGLVDLSVAKLDRQNPQFTWRAPLVNCNPAATQFSYEFRVVELMPGQQPDDAMERNASVYIVRDLTVPMVTIPPTYIKRMDPKKTYVAQVKARQSGLGAQMIGYVMIENEGKSPLRMFSVPEVNDGANAFNETLAGFTDPGTIRDYGDDGDGETTPKGKVQPRKKGDKLDSVYVFCQPKITYPTWDEGYTRKCYLGSDLVVEWKKIYKTGGEGQRPDTLDLKYDVELFKTTYDADYQEAFKQKPLLKKTVGKGEDNVTLEWDDELEKLELVHNDYLVLRVNPVIKGEKSIRFEDGSDNIVGFAMTEHTSKSYFQCSGSTEIANTTPTKKKADELKGKKVALGEYNLTIDQIEKVKGRDFFTGKGHVEWNPMGTKVMVAVLFDTLYINTDDQVYGGRCKSYTAEAQKKASDSEVVDKLFSDWGIDNFFGDNSIPYADKIQQGITDKAKDAAKKLKLAKYYGWVKSGHSVVDQFLKGEVSDLHTPISIPKDYNQSPCDIQISKMVFGPTYATMDLIAEFVMPDTKYSDNDILVFGAPRLCMSPTSMLPESGTVALLGDFTVVDPASSYTCTFKCPQNALTPEDGTFLSWHADKFEQLGIDVEMAIPGTMKEVNGQPTEENATVRLTGTVSDWDDLIMRGKMAPFQVSEAQGYTFTAQDVVIDRSKYRNFQGMTLPKGYSRAKLQIAESGEDVKWTGLYIREVSAKLPESFEFGTEEEGRLSVALEKMYFDKSGATFTAAVNDLVHAKTGKVGGWAFHMDKVFLNVMQNDFTDCGFSGRIGVPLLRMGKNDDPAEINFDCRMMKIKSGIGQGKMAYVFKTYQTKNLSLDCFLAETEFDEKQTYLLVEAAPNEGGKLETNVELVMGGTMTIKGTKWVNDKLEKLPLDLSLSGIHFCGMRIANCKSDWVSRFESEMQSTARNAKLKGKEIYNGKDIAIYEDKLYFTPGRFSFSSDEKWFGPFNFSLDKYDFSYFKEGSKDLLKFTLGGSVKFLDNLDLCGVGAQVSVMAEVKMPSGFNSLSDFSMKYYTFNFEKVSIDMAAAGCKLKGDLEVLLHDDEREGFSGNLKVTLPGDFLADVECNGGFYRNKKGGKFNYGWFYTELKTSVGIEIFPVQINGGELGLYYNCARDKDKLAVPKKDSFGFILGVKLAAIDATLWNCDIRNTTVFDTKRGCLSSMVFTGTFKGMSGAMDGECNLTYNHDKNDRYLALDATIDATTSTDKIVQQVVERFGADMEDLKGVLDAGYEELKQLVPEGMMQGKFNDGESKKPNSGDKYNGEDLAAAKGISIEQGYVVTVGMKLTFMEKGQKLKPVKWYICLGEPPIEKRCRYTWLKFDTGIVSADVCANGYLCVGNQLYENGSLPEIPQKIRSFLNGKGITNGTGTIEGASLSQAERARQNALRDFESQFDSNGGGVMLGGQLYGYFKVNLGLLKFDAGLTAGFDVSLMHLANNSYCINLKNKDGKVLRPGWDGWYGKGQLYAYLYAKLGVYVDIGFWSGHWDIADAGVGGVFNFYGPRPTHMSGEARVKLSLMDGWVDIDRKYEFDVGDGCNLFAGNALDEFKLFGDLSIAKDDRSGWDYDNRIDPKLIAKPVLRTEAPLEEPFRVVDPTALGVLESKYVGADKAAMEVEASRTFIFRSNVGSIESVWGDF